MIVKDLLNRCTVSGVARVIAEMAKCPQEDSVDLEKRCQLIIDELKASNEDWVLDNPDFCFVAIETDETAIPYVTLTHLSELKNNNYSISCVTEFSWFWGQMLGVYVDEESCKIYGADTMLGGILYHITYFDCAESEIRPIRESVEGILDMSKISQMEYYVAVNHQLCEQQKS